MLTEQGPRSAELVNRRNLRQSARRAFPSVRPALLALAWPAICSKSWLASPLATGKRAVKKTDAARLPLVGPCYPLGEQRRGPACSAVYRPEPRLCSGASLAWAG